MLLLTQTSRPLYSWAIKNFTGHRHQSEVGNITFAARWACHGVEQAAAVGQSLLRAHEFESPMGGVLWGSVMLTTDVVTGLRSKSP